MAGYFQKVSMELATSSTKLQQVKYIAHNRTAPLMR